jgi:hypothetical protein
MNTMMTDGEEATEGRNRLAVAAGAALFAAGVILVLFVLPAEFGIDPLGTGRRTGLLELGITGQQVEALENAKAAGTGGTGSIVSAQEKPFNHETVEFKLGPSDWVEYKYRLEKGEALLYSWTASGPVDFDFHAEPDSGPRGYAQDYEKGQAASKTGTMTAPFTGIHGWYWQNTGNQAVTVTLTSSGFYNMSHEFHDGLPTKNKMFQ